MSALASRWPIPERAHPPAPAAASLSPARSTLYDQIGRSIGDDAAGKLVADFGGRRLYIPIAPSPGDIVTRSIGLTAALQMARIFGGDRLLIPAGCDHARRRARILAMRAERISISRIARELRCTERYVYKVLALERGSRAPSPEPPAPAAVATSSSPAELKRATCRKP